MLILNGKGHIMFIPELKTVFPDNNINYNICNEEFVELNNFLCEHFYAKQNLKGAINKCYLRKSVAEKLKKAELSLPNGYKFKIYDGWRPFSVQKSLYDNYRNKVETSLPGLTDEEINDLTKLFVSPPLWDKKAGPVHTTGGAVDLTIVDNFGNEINMGTEFDCFKDTANTNYYELNNINDEIRNNRRLLYNAMLQAGFTNLPTEWWHFDYGNKFWAFYTGNDAIYNCKFELEEL